MSQWYMSRNEGKILIICMYVDDRIYIGNMLLEDVKEEIEIEFDMTNLGGNEILLRYLNSTIY